MCGIVGGTGRISERTLGRLIDSQRRRGPDGRGTFSVDRGFLGISRLAVIAPGAHPGPYASEEGHVVAVMNGEIYNEPSLRQELTARGHEFSTAVDTEVIVHAYEEWGSAFVERLNGIFAFLLLDLKEQLLLAARDRLGIKPLFLRRSSRGVVYASTLRALRELSRNGLRLCPRGLLEFLYRQSIAAPRTIYRDVEAVEPGSFHLWPLEEGAASRVCRYWRPHSVATDLDATSPLAVLDRLDETLHEVCERQARRDRRASLALSGGIDSGLLATETEATGLADDAVFLVHPESSGELELARATATSTGLALRALSPGGALEEAVGDWVEAAETPPADGFNTFLLCRALPDETVVLYSGLGADELFNGYPELRAAVSDPDPAELARRFFRVTALMPPAVLEIVSEAVGIDWQEVADALLTDALDSMRELQDGSSAECLRYLLITHYLSSCLLPDADVFSMYHGVELRVPFLDHAVIDLALSLPYAALSGPEPPQAKNLLRWLAARRGMPPAVLAARKRGFALPYERLAARFPASGTAAAALPEDHPATPYRAWVLAAVGRWLAQQGYDLPGLGVDDGEAHTAVAVPAIQETSTST